MTNPNRHRLIIKFLRFISTKRSKTQIKRITEQDIPRFHFFTGSKSGKVNLDDGSYAREIELDISICTGI